MDLTLSYVLLAKLFLSKVRMIYLILGNTQITEIESNPIIQRRSPITI